MSMYVSVRNRPSTWIGKHSAAAVLVVVASMLSLPLAAADYHTQVLGEMSIPVDHMAKLNFYNVEHAQANVTFKIVDAKQGQTTGDVLCEKTVSDVMPAEGAALSYPSYDDCPGAVYSERIIGVVTVAFEDPFFLKTPSSSRTRSFSRIRSS